MVAAMRRQAFFFVRLAALVLLAHGCTVEGYTYEDAFVPDAGTTEDAGNDAFSTVDVGRMRIDASACDFTDLGSTIGMVASGSTAGQPNRHTPTCSTTMAPDAWFRWVAPTAGNWVFDTAGSDFDTVLEVQTDCIDGTLGCNDDGPLDSTSRVQVTLTAGQSVMIIVDGYGSMTGNYVLHVQTIPAEICNNGIDDDEDFLTDCEDDDCASDPSCHEIGAQCSDRIDNDDDFETDCFDSDCAGEPACDESMHCDDHVDNDGDGEVDCADFDCASMAICLETGANCMDGIDNDVDGLTDCADGDCASLTDCSESMNCTDGRDNDGDDLADCADSDCATNAACTTPEVCGNGVDDDHDGLVDCADTGCTAQCTENTPARCMDTLDNDSDGLTDCADLQCSCTSVCPPAVMPSTTCPDADLGMMVGDGVYHGTITGYACGARSDASCGTTHGAGAEVELSWTAPMNGTYVFDTEDTGGAGDVFDTIVTLRTQCMGGSAAEFACDDDSGTGHLSRVSHFLVAGEMVVVVVDSQNVWDGGNVTLNIHRM
jgi:hypothetical protein